MRKVAPFNEREILRYAGVRGEADESTKALLAVCLAECENAFSYRERHLLLSREELYATIPDARNSRGISEALGNCKRVVIFAATVGIGIDRLIARYASVAPSKALLFQAIGAERIEAFCDGLCNELAQEIAPLKSRFSAGYGDFPLSAQKDIFRLLDCPKQIGLTLTDSLLMSPTKSVTAIVGVDG